LAAAEALVANGKPSAIASSAAGMIRIECLLIRPVRVRFVVSRESLSTIYGHFQKDGAFFRIQTYQANVTDMLTLFKLARTR
jgi:hypothetical protein